MKNLKYEIIFYKKLSGEIPIRTFFDKLTDKHVAKARRMIDLLEEFGTELKMPYCQYLQEGIWELRIKFASDISRIAYFLYTDNKIVLLNGFIKKTQKTPKGEIELALKYKKDYEKSNKERIKK